jgi:hypothetical protein
LTGAGRNGREVAANVLGALNKQAKKADVALALIDVSVDPTKTLILFRAAE